MDRFQKAMRHLDAVKRKEIVNAARMFERAVALRHAAARDVFAANRAGLETASWRARYDAQNLETQQAYRMLARQFSIGEQALIDGILYVKVLDVVAHESLGPLLRVVLADLKDWGKTKHRAEKPGPGDEP